MSISLQKGQKVNLTKENPGLKQVRVGLGWDVNESTGADFDLDAFAVLLRGDKLKKEKDIVCYWNLMHKSGAVRHLGDNLTGGGDGDDEQILINLVDLPEKYDRIVLAVNIYDCKRRKQHFGKIRNAFIRLVDEETGREICKYNLSEDYTGMTSMLFGEIYKVNNEWKFNAIGQGTKDKSIDKFCKQFIERFKLSFSLEIN